MKIPYVIGETIYLRSPMEIDAESSWINWLNDEETTKWLVDQYWPKSSSEQKNFVKYTNKDKSRLVLLIIDKEKEKPIGVCSLSSINYVHRYCSIAIIIGEKKYRQGKCLIEAFSLLLGVAFKRLNMRYVRSAFVNGNEASEMLHKLFRFQECGCYPDTFWDGKTFRDIKILSLSQQNWLRNNEK